jgi:hypothetical protein
LGDPAVVCCGPFEIRATIEAVPLDVRPSEANAARRSFPDSKTNIAPSRTASGHPGSRIRTDEIVRSHEEFDTVTQDPSPTNCNLVRRNENDLESDLSLRLSNSEFLPDEFDIPRCGRKLQDVVVDDKEWIVVLVEQLAIQGD